MRKGEAGTAEDTAEVAAVEGPDSTEDMAEHTMEADSMGAVGIAPGIDTTEHIDTTEDIGITGPIPPSGGMA
jgi:hypothetical protein